jgi:hypothetical protein
MHEGTKLLLRAFEAGAFGGPATKPPEELPIPDAHASEADLDAFLKSLRIPLPASDSDADRRAYIGKCLARTWSHKPRVDTVFVPRAFVRMGWTRVWLEVAGVLAPDAPRGDQDGEQRALMEAAAVANAIEAEADLIDGAGRREMILSEREREVDELIRREGPLTGKEICNRLGIGDKVLSNHVIPALKKERGLKNQRSRGYFYPT